MESKEDWLCNNCQSQSSITFGFFKLSEKGLNDTHFANNVVEKINGIIKADIALKGSAFLLNLNEGLNDDNKFAAYLYVAGVAVTSN